MFVHQRNGANISVFSFFIYLFCVVDLKIIILMPIEMCEFEHQSIDFVFSLCFVHQSINQSINLLPIHCRCEFYFSNFKSN